MRAARERAEAERAANEKAAAEYAKGREAHQRRLDAEKTAAAERRRLMRLEVEGQPSRKPRKP